MKFSKGFLQELAIGCHDKDTEIISDEIYDTSRWSVHHELIFKNLGKFYRTSYSRGATEYQDESPFEHDGDEIECDEVRPVERTVIVYEPVKEGE